ncbi:Crp/Fnr family transcriptional regulator, partial [Phocaeicola sp.]|uniref:Crp/Fnr family transcriptional regulator n=1 Tax=Phocaeicola sp. TaxID=2773926 RepID=UPI003A92B695
DILEKVKIHFNKYEPGSCLVRQDTPCNQLIFVLGGEVQIESNDRTHKYTIWENFKSPNVIEPYSLFGMRPYFTASYTAVTEVNTLNIDKAYILNELCRYEVFNLNYMNMLSNRSQVIYNKLWNAHIGKTRDKIINFLLLRCMTPYGAKKLSIRMEDLARLIDDTRINVSNVLNDLQNRGLIQLGRRTFSIPELREVVLLLNKKD